MHKPYPAPLFLWMRTHPIKLRRDVWKSICIDFSLWLIGIDRGRELTKWMSNNSNFLDYLHYCTTVPLYPLSISFMHEDTLPLNCDVTHELSIYSNHVAHQINFYLKVCNLPLLSNIKPISFSTFALWPRSSLAQSQQPWVASTMARGERRKLTPEMMIATAGWTSSGRMAATLGQSRHRQGKGSSQAGATTIDHASPLNFSVLLSLRKGNHRWRRPAAVVRGGEGVRSAQEEDRKG